MSLDNQMLGRLVIDRAMGELSGDMAALLDNYLSANQEQLLASRSIMATVADARRSLTRSDYAVTEALPPPLFGRVSPRKVWVTNAVRGGFVGFAAAAAIALALWMGYGPTPQSKQMELTRQTMVSSDVHDAPRGVAGFWSVSDLRRGFSAKRSTENRKVEWTGPITRPKIGA